MLSQDVARGAGVIVRVWLNKLHQIQDGSDRLSSTQLQSTADLTFGCATVVSDASCMRPPLREVIQDKAWHTSMPGVSASS